MIYRLGFFNSIIYLHAVLIQQKPLCIISLSLAKVYACYIKKCNLNVCYYMEIHFHMEKIKLLIGIII